MIARTLAAFRPRPPQTRVDFWHISPGIDALAYAFSWLWMLLPFYFAGPTHPTDYLWFWIVGNALSTGHRHLTMPYVYLDSQVFRAHAGRFLIVPSVLLTGFLFSGLYRSWRIPAGFFTATDIAVAGIAALLFAQWWWMDKVHGFSRAVLGALVVLPLALFGAIWAVPAGPDHAAVSLACGLLMLLISAWVAWEGRAQRSVFGSSVVPVAILSLLALAVAAAGGSRPMGPVSPIRVRLITGAVAGFAAAWNIWHVYMQKYGILRMYAAKSGLPRERWVPGWVDRFLVFGWVPAYFMYLPTQARPLLREHAPSVLHWLEPLLSRLESVAVVGLPVTLLVGAASVAAYFLYEYRASHFENPARLTMGVGTVLLALTFLLLDPFQAYIAFGFSHAVEYSVFVWAFQRRRYRQELAHQPILGQLLRNPALFYGVFFLIVGGGYAVLEFGSGTLYEGRPKLAGTPVRSWIFYWTVWHSMAHFYFDSFLWKMRLPEVRASL